MPTARTLYLTAEIFLSALLAGCSHNDATVIDSNSQAGSVASGGSNGTGGTSSVGGASHTTSMTNSGGALGTGGSANKGGTSAVGSPTGGSAGSTGSSASATGGVSLGGTSARPTAGANNNGGSGNLAGAVATGGRISTGGLTQASGASTGGTVTGGQANAMGGAATGGQSCAVGGQGTASFPFPQNRRAANCIYPDAYSNCDALKVYNAWKSDLVTSDGVGSSCSNCQRVKRPAEPGLQTQSTVSEGIGYGMIIAVYMNDQSLLDDLWRYEQAHTWSCQPTQCSASTSTSLMNWYIASDGTVATTANGGQSGNGAATDADEDMAWALVIASKQWGGQGSLSKTYVAYAQQLLNDIWKFEIDTGSQTTNKLLPKNGSSWGNDSCLNISYFAPAYYRAFANVSGQTSNNWNGVVADVYQVISQSLNATNGNQSNGLVPAFSTSAGATANCGVGSPTEPHTYQYDSCRTPFRIGLDACFNDSTDAISYVAKTTSFFSAQGDASKIVDGYQLNGTPNPQYPGGTYNGLSAAFIGPAGVGAMHKQNGQNYQSFVDDVYGLVSQNNLWCGGQYYDESWTMLSMLMMTGNFLDYTK